jgi:hypothetical protein
MSNIVGLDGQPKAVPEKTYDYQFTMKDGSVATEHGLLSFNPVFASAVDADGKLLFMTPLDNINHVKRLG